jgi:leader peptidase (prepilin peptidase)/N-methyltransferase
MPLDTLLYAAPASVAATIAAVILGLLVGSFLNVVVHRLPIMSQRELDNYIAHEAGKELPHQDSFNLMTPRSRCPHCGHCSCVANAAPARPRSRRAIRPSSWRPASCPAW